MQEDSLCVKYARLLSEKTGRQNNMTAIDWKEFGLPDPPSGETNGQQWDRGVAWLTLKKLSGVEKRVDQIYEGGCSKYCAIDNRLSTLEKSDLEQAKTLTGAKKLWHQVQGGLKVLVWLAAIVYFGIQGVAAILDILK